MRKKVTLALATVSVVTAVVILRSIGLFVQSDRNNAESVLLAPRQKAQAFVKQLSHAFLVIGHRGNSSEAPENTLAAINEAFALGAGMVEVDVHLSRDGVPVVIHDESVDRTTNGKGLVSQLTVTQLKTLDAGSWKDRKYAGERIPTLAEALQAAKAKGPLLLDLKVDGMGRVVAEVLRGLNLPDSSVVIGTWTASQTSDFARYLPRVQILMSSADALKKWDSDYFTKERARGITGFEIVVDNLSNAFIADAHAHRMPVYAFTVNDEGTMRKLIEMGIDGIETDVPAVLVRLMNEIGKQQE